MDISGHRSKSVRELANVRFDYVVTVCSHAHESCPVFPGKVKMVHMGFEDPPRLAAAAKTTEEAIDCHRRVRDEIRAFVMQLPERLLEERRSPERDEGMTMKQTSETRSCCSAKVPGGEADTKTASMLYTPAVDELVAIAAAIACNCERCFKYHYAQAKKLGVSHEDMARAVATAQRVKSSPAGAILQLAQRHLHGAYIPEVTTIVNDPCAQPELNELDEAASACCPKRD